MTIETATELALADVAINNSATSQHTYRSMSRTCLAYWGADRELASITRQEVQAWINTRKLQVRAQTVRSELSWLNRLYRTAEDAGESIIPPTQRLRRPPVRNKRDRVLTQSEQAALRKILDKWDYSIVEFVLQTGLRRLEVWRIRPHDVQFFEREVRGQKITLGMLHVWTSKTGKPRNVPLNPLAAGIALAWSKRSEGQDWLFSPYGANRLSCAHNWVNRVFVPAVKQAVAGRFTFHQLRHTFATRALQGGARLEQISWALGHQSVVETESRYAHWSVDQVWPAVLAGARARSA